MIVIIDDEYDFAEFLKHKLEKKYIDKEIKILTEFNHEFLVTNDIEILFLDIELKNKNGIEQARKLRELGYDNLNIVFISCHDNFVYNTFGVRPLDFIRKSRLNSDLERCVELIKKKKEREEMQTIIDGQLVRLIDVLYIESRGNNVIYKGINDNVILERRIKLSDIEKELEKYHFIRCHKSYIVNANHVTKACTNYVIVNNNIKIPISRSKQEYFINKYHDYYIEKKYSKLC